MIISHSKKYVFIHIYKTAGTSITSELIKHARFIEKISTYWSTRYIVTLLANLFSLEDLGKSWINGVHKHATAGEIRDYLGKDRYKQYFSFSFVRNPFDLQVSLYHYIKNSPEHRDYDIANKITFKQFVLREIKNRVKKQIDFLRDEDGIIVDYIGRFEKIEESMQFIYNKLNLPSKSIVHQNKSTRLEGYRDYYDDELRLSVEQYFKDDLKTFKYEF
jgi:hypothetical protein